MFMTHFMNFKLYFPAKLFGYDTLCDFRNAPMSGRTFSKTVVLLTSPSARRVPVGKDKLKLYLNKHIFEAVEIPIDLDGSGLMAFFNNLFQSKLQGARYISRLYFNSIPFLHCTLLQAWDHFNLSFKFRLYFYYR